MKSSKTVSHVSYVTDVVIRPGDYEAKVTVFPYPLEVDYAANRVYRDGAAGVTLKKNVGK